RDSQSRGGQEELPLRPAQAGLCDAHLQAGLLVLLLAGLDLFQRDLDLLAARALMSACDARGDRLVARDRRPALLHLLLARQDREQEDPGDAADREGSQEEERERLHLEHGRTYRGSGSSAISAASSAAARRASSP